MTLRIEKTCTATRPPPPPPTRTRCWLCAGDLESRGSNGGILQCVMCYLIKLEIICPFNDVIAHIDTQSQLNEYI